MVGARYALPILPSRFASGRRGASTIACNAHRVGLPIVGATRRVAHNGRGTACRAPTGRAPQAVPCPTHHPTTACWCASPIAPRRPSRRGDPPGRPQWSGYGMPYPHAVPCPTHHPTTACRCASPIAPHRPSRRGDPAGRPQWSGHGMPCPSCRAPTSVPVRVGTTRCVAHRVGATRRVAHNGRGTVYRAPTGRTPTPTTACRCASPIACVTHRIGLPIVGATRRVAHNGRGTVYRAPTGRTPTPTTACRCASPIACVAHRVGATRRVAQNGRGTACRTPRRPRPNPHHRVPVSVAHRTASPIASGRPGGSPLHTAPPPQAVPCPTHHHTTAYRCASPIAPRRPSRRGDPAGRPQWSGHGMPCPHRPYRVPPITTPRHTGAHRPSHRVAHRVGSPIMVGARHAVPLPTVPILPSRCASPIAPRRPSRRGDPARRPDVPCCRALLHTNGTSHP
ncbi:MAG: hypothetical protein KatS3mg055_0013 [Chloroflexus sp.]|nr:MAG: hypothetical protein KatS3mg055_0013 [Chloroflexus sp.]